MAQLSIVKDSNQKELFSQEWLSEKNITDNFLKIETLFKQNMSYLYVVVCSDYEQTKRYGEPEKYFHVVAYKIIADRYLKFIKNLPWRDELEEGYFDNLPEKIEREVKDQREFFNVLRLFSEERLGGYFKALRPTEEEILQVYAQGIEAQQKKIEDREEQLKNLYQKAQEEGYFNIVRQIVMSSKKCEGEEYVDNTLWPDEEEKYWQCAIMRVIEEWNFDKIKRLQVVMKEQKVENIEAKMGEVLAQKLIEKGDLLLETFEQEKNIFDFKTLTYCLCNILVSKQIDKEIKQNILKIFKEKYSTVQIEEDESIRSYIERASECIFYYELDLRGDFLKIFGNNLREKELFVILESAITCHNWELIKIIFDIPGFNLNTFSFKKLRDLMKLIQNVKEIDILEIFLKKMENDKIYDLRSHIIFFQMLFAFEKLKSLKGNSEVVQNLEPIFSEKKRASDNLNKLINFKLLGEEMGIGNFIRSALKYDRFDLLWLNERIWKGKAWQIVQEAIHQNKISVVEHYLPLFNVNNDGAEGGNRVCSPAGEFFREGVFLCWDDCLDGEREEIREKIENKILEELTEVKDIFSWLTLMLNEVDIPSRSSSERMKIVKTAAEYVEIKKGVDGKENLRMFRNGIIEGPIYQLYELKKLACEKKISQEQWSNYLDNVKKILEFISAHIDERDFLRYKLCGIIINPFNRLGDRLGDDDSFNDSTRELIKIMNEISYQNNEIYEEIILQVAQYDEWSRAVPYAGNILKNPDISISGQCLGEALLENTKAKGGLIPFICQNKNFHQIPITSLWKAILTGSKGCFTLIKSTFISRKFVSVITFPVLLSVSLIGLARYAVGRYQKIMSHHNSEGG